MTTVLQLAWAKYLKELDRRPLRTKALTSASICVLSDVVAQAIAGSSLNWRRMLAMGAFGLLWAGPSSHFWQQFMEHIHGSKKDLATLIRKVVFDQVTYGPLANLAFMSFITLVMEGQSVEGLKTKVKRDFAAVQINGWRLWPVVGLINYKFVPLKFRVLFLNVVAFFWATFLNVASRAPAVKMVKA